MKLLIDGQTTSPSCDVGCVVEATSNGDKKYYIKGIFAQSEVKNRNGRTYPRAVMERALKEYEPHIKAKRALGEMMHPSHPNVNLERASHIIETLSWDGNNVVGKARIMTEMPMGRIAKNLIDEGVQFGVSTRGLGSIAEKNGVNVVQDDFTMTAIDIVGDPSGPDCWMNALVEGSDWVFNASTNSWELAEQMRTNVMRMSAKQVAESQAKLFEEFLNSLR